MFNYDVMMLTILFHVNGILMCYRLLCASQYVGYEIPTWCVKEIGNLCPRYLSYAL